MRVLQTGIVLYDRRKGGPSGPAQTGDVAELASGRLVARCHFDFGDGTGGSGCRTYDQGELPETAPCIPAPTNWGRWIDAELNRHPGQYRGLGPRDYDREIAEVKKFRGEWPLITARLAEVLDLGALPTALFGLGQILWADTGVFLAGYSIDWRQLADRHASGSFGCHGEYSDTPVTEEQLWTLGEQPILVANKVAIAAKSGAVRSRFVLPKARTQDDRKLGAVDVVTVLAPRGPRTLMSTAYVDVEPSTNVTDT
jgi:hypothetical protein